MSKALEEFRAIEALYRSLKIEAERLYAMCFTNEPGFVDLEDEFKLIEATLKDYENLKSHYDELNKMFNNAMFLNKVNEKVIDAFRKVVDFNVYEMQGSYYLTTGNNYRGQIPIDKEIYEMLKGELR